MKTITTTSVMVWGDANIHGNTGNTENEAPYASVWVADTMLLFWDKGQLEALRDLCNKQLEEWK